MAETMFLYWGSGSPPCWATMLALEEKGFSGYRNKLLSFSKKEQKREDVLKLNPRGQLPTFKDGDLVINESKAICLYLENQYHDKGLQLIPDGHKEKALALQRMFEVQNLRSGPMEKIFMYLSSTPEENRDQKVLDEHYSQARNELGLWENYLKEIGDGAFIAGTNFTMADVFFFPLVAICVRLGLQIEKFPALLDYYKRLCDRPSVQASWPPHWKDEPGPKMLNAV
ncbi:hypothetical protein ScPMuIL_009108 [Solemya velum]